MGDFLLVVPSWVTLTSVAVLGHILQFVDELVL